MQTSSTRYRSFSTFTSVLERLVDVRYDHDRRPLRTMEEASETPNNQLGTDKPRQRRRGRAVRIEVQDEVARLLLLDRYTKAQIYMRLESNDQLPQPLPAKKT